MWNTIGNFLFPSLYWKGRQEGWFACEHMIITRAKANPVYDNIWEELIQ